MSGFVSPFAKPSNTDIMADMNAAQRLAAEHDQGPALVLAGAGSGKTRVITTRFAHLVRHHKIRPRRILTVTFTRKAADEMRDRIKALLGAQQVAAAPVGTMHGIALGQLRQAPEVAGLREGFTIADEARCHQLLRQIMEAADAEDTERDTIKALLGMITAIKDKGYTPATAMADAEALRQTFPKSAHGLFDEALAWFEAFQTSLRAENSADFADILLWPTLAMEKALDGVVDGVDGAALQAQWAGAFDRIMVDEYQDTSPLQERWIRCLADHGHLFVVGDDSQAIYAFRGSDSGFILSFVDRWPGCRLYHLLENYRCSPVILAAANRLISHNAHRHPKELVAAKGGPGWRPVRVGEAETRYVEAAWIVEMARLLIAESDMDGGQVSIYVCYRAGAMSRRFEEAAIAAGVPYAIVGDTGFYGRQEIKDALAYMRMMDAPADRVAWERVANLPARGLGEKTMALIVEEAAASEDGDLIAAGVRLADRFELRKDGAEGARELARLQEAWNAATWGQTLLDERVEAVLRDSGYMAHWRNHDDPKADDRLDNIAEFLTLCREAGGIDELFERARKAAEAETDSAQLVFMTLHASKGLEADVVFLPGWEERTFPTRHAVDAEADGSRRGTAAIEEERNLGYVGVTRARSELIITWSASDGEGPSRFIDELKGDAPHDVVEAFDIPYLPRSDQESSDAQKATARECASSLGLALPDSVLRNRRLVSIWLDRYLADVARNEARLSGK